MCYVDSSNLDLDSLCCWYYYMQPAVMNVHCEAEKRNHLSFMNKRIKYAV